MVKVQISEMGSKNKKVVFLLSGWQNRLWMYWPFSKILSLNGFYCITYAYDNDVLSPDVAKTTRHLNTISNEILQRIKNLKKAGYKDFSVFGTSLGSIIALMVANKSSEISKVILNTTGADISDVVWEWKKVFVWFRKKLIEQGYTKPQLKREWKSISPINNINNLKDKRLLIYLSEKDEIIPFKFGMQLVEEFRKLNYDYDLVINTKRGHIGCGTFNLFNAFKYLSFLKNKK